jgi:quinol monooxygenase YgiN
MKIILLSLITLSFVCNSAVAQSNRPSKPGESSYSNNPSPIILISHVDVMPSYTVGAVQLLKQYHSDSMKEKGATRVEILQQVGRPNHFTIVEEWATDKDYNDHVSASQTRNFRGALQSMLGAPYDERPHTSLNN